MICPHLEAWGERNGKKIVSENGYTGVSANLEDITIIHKELIDICIYCRVARCFMDIQKYNRRCKNENLLNKTGD